MTFDLEKIQSETFLEYIEFHKQLESTNDLASQLIAQAKLPIPMLVLAEEQTSGRGRGNNDWWSSAGSITMSLVVDAAEYTSTVCSLPFVSLMAGLAVCRVVDDLLQPESARVKWPNDVFVKRQKVAGLLVENPLVDSGRMIIGVGLNVNNSFEIAPPELRTTATSLFDLTRKSIDLTDCVLAVVRQLELVSKISRDDLLDEFASRDILNGHCVSIRNGDQLISGTCAGIDRDGSLRLAINGTMQTIHSGVIETIDWQS